MQFKNNYFIIKIWILHYLVYYWAFSLFFSLLSIWYKDYNFKFDDYIFYILFAPVVALFGFVDGLVIFIPVIIFYLFKIKYSYFQSYLVTIILCYTIINIYLLFFVDGNYYVRSNQKEKNFEFNNFLIVLPCVLISIIIHWFTFRKSYQKLANEKK